MARGATVDEAFAQMRKAILTSSQPLALAEIEPPPESAVPPDAPPPADVAVPAERPGTAYGGPKRSWRVALTVLLILALAFAAFQFLA